MLASSAETVFVKQQIWNATCTQRIMYPLCTCITIFSDLKSIFEGDELEGEYAEKNTLNEIEWMNKKSYLKRNF